MAKTLSSLVGGGAFPFVNEIPWAAGSPALLKNLDAYFGNTVANQQKLGHGFQWFSADASIPTTWTNYLSLTGPGCIDFLAVYMESGADADDVEMRIDIDGNTGPVMPNMSTAASSSPCTSQPVLTCTCRGRRAPSPTTMRAYTGGMKRNEV
jgi:hypothetical protein